MCGGGRAVSERIVQSIEDSKLDTAETSGIEPDRAAPAEFLFFVMWACGARWFVSIYTCSTRMPAATWDELEAPAAVVKDSLERGRKIYS